MQQERNLVICPPCGENVGLPTKRGANKVSPILPLLPRLTAVLPPQGREIAAHGFTLIELLVVVLIIGILAAVAVPQYTKAVRKARIAEAKVILKQLTDAQDVWYLSTNSVNSPTWEELDVEIPTETKNWSFYRDECAADFDVPGNNGLTGCANYARPKWESGYNIGYASPNYNSGVTDFSGHFICTIDETICTGLGGVQSEDWDDTYILP